MKIRLLKTLVLVSTLATAALVLLGFLSFLHPLADALSHFRFHLAMGLLLLAAIAYFTHGLRLFAGALCCAIVALWSVYFPVNASPITAQQEGVRQLVLVQYNVSFRNRQSDQISKFIRNASADVVTLQEITQKSGLFLERLKPEYPWQIVCPFATVGAVAIISRYPMLEREGSKCIKGLGLVWMRIRFEDRVLSIASVHLHWPYPYSQSRHIDRLEKWLKTIPRPVIMAGDFNAAPWSHAVTRIARATETQVVEGLRFSIALKPFNIEPGIELPIDHLLLSEQFFAKTMQVGPSAGSDHASLVAEIGLKKTGGKGDTGKNGKP